MNPNLPLEEGNIIPQCQICNQADRNRWIYDKTGRVIEVADTSDGYSVVKRFIQSASKITLQKLYKLIKSIIDRIGIF